MLRSAAVVCGQFLLVAAAIWVVGWIVIQLRLVVIPVAIALLLAALLAPAMGLLVRRKVPRGVATAIVLVGGIAVLVAVLSFVIRAFVAGLPDLSARLTQSYQQFQEFLAGPPFNISSEQLRNLPDAIGRSISENRDTLTSGALTTAATVAEIVTGMFLALFSLIFFLYDGPSIWRFVLRAVPTQRRDRMDVAGRRSFASLVGYTRATALVAVVDATFIGLGLLIVGVPLVIPLAALIFLGSFIPTVGAVVTGAIAVLVALVTNGPVAALIVLAVVIGVQQLEGHVLQPLLLGRAVQLHPLAVVLAVAAGVVLGGVIGALLAVPLLAVINSGMRSLAADRQPSPTAVDPKDAEDAEDAEGRPSWLAKVRSVLPGQS
ncbi:MAG: AI-2E family transporter [Pseudonocardiales bacterium]|nr:AI-2E family transporter [Pseudonocardiales bacterium]